MLTPCRPPAKKQAIAEELANDLRRENESLKCAESCDRYEEHLCAVTMVGPQSVNPVWKYGENTDQPPQSTLTTAKPISVLRGNRWRVFPREEVE